MKRLFIFLFTINFGAIIFLSCKKEKTCEGCIDGNKPPISIAGPDQVITLPADSISLDGSASNDPDGTISVWLWKKISGPASFNIVNAVTSRTVVRDLDTGVYRFELKVTDNKNLSTTDTVQIAVVDPRQPNRPPVAIAGSDQTIMLPTHFVNLDGSATTDPDNNIISYLWKKIFGPSSFNISNATAVQTQVTNLTEGMYEFELQVTDAGGLSSKDTARINVSTQPPNNSCPPTNRPLVSAQLIPVGSLSIARSGITTVSSGNKLFFAGGHNGSAVSRVDIYDLSTQNWSQSELSVPRYSMAAVAAGDKVFFAGGETNITSSVSSRVDIYNVSTQSWSTAELSEARGDIAAAVVGDKVLFAGGYRNISNGPGLPSSRVDIFNLSTQTWSTANLSEPRGFITPVTAENKVYFAGGDPGNINHTGSNKIDIYDNTTGTWSVSTLNEGKAFFAGIYNNGKIYWAGGTNDINPGAGEIYSCHVEIRDINSQASSFTNLYEPKQYIKAFEKDNRIIFVKHDALWDFQNGGQWNFDIYDIITNTWSIGVVNQPSLAWPGSWISHNNIIYMAGGYPNGSGFSNQVWKLEF